jgi:hypothetical protein
MFLAAFSLLVEALLLFVEALLLLVEAVSLFFGARSPELPAVSPLAAALFLYRASRSPMFKGRSALFAVRRRRRARLCEWLGDTGGDRVVRPQDEGDVSPFLTGLRELLGDPGSILGALSRLFEDRSPFAGALFLFFGSASPRHLRSGRRCRLERDFCPAPRPHFRVFPRAWEELRGRRACASRVGLQSRRKVDTLSREQAGLRPLRRATRAGNARRPEVCGLHQVSAHRRLP